MASRIYEFLRIHWPNSSEFGNSSCIDLDITIVLSKKSIFMKTIDTLEVDPKTDILALLGY